MCVDVQMENRECEERKRKEVKGEERETDKGKRVCEGV